MSERRRRIGDGLAVLAGARPDVLAAAPGARPRFVALGGVLLSTGALAAVSAAFAVAMALNVWWPLAVLVGLGWGAVVVNLDRMLLVGMAHDASVKRNLVMAVPRAGLALVLGVVVATPLTLQVFAKEIDAEIVTMQAEAADAHRVALESDSRFAGLPGLRERIATQEAVVASGGAADPGLAVVRDGVTEKQAAYDRAVTLQRELDAKAQCELDGTCGTGDAGTGEAYHQARAAADAQAGVVTAARTELDAAVAAVAAAEGRSAALAGSSLDADRAELTRLTAELDRQQAAFDAENEGSGGILLRLEALDRLGDRNATLAAAQFMLSLLFMCVEVLPVLMKLLLNFSPPTAYDRLVQLRDSGDVELEEMAQESRRTVARAKEELLVLAERERVDRQKEAILARRRAALAEVAARTGAARSQPEAPAVEEPAEAPRQLWDTGPIRELARNAAVRTVRSVRRRPADRTPTTV
ncbi:DUF4407 domain-containing protein [Blastococcus sp. MG754426]|uniref:DUF4407 domain-containing protein n=1 Tax=unclassified Blastococcus TaxID=2619396 RepID=UPI002714C501|nr:MULTISPECIES: DUF4407 domain-containing protein [unclassified Blastococcus]MCF6509719.1 DUF4407 domain-containing protein [Blastococcus sp. MG754426]MCF6514113.1 DUF4407 domain-containing protein [Blastococcus sp. MG754427]MCF6737205.1 DUF4407 domain-containing protein [Blastococcus sp. KM273129]